MLNISGSAWLYRTLRCDRVLGACVLYLGGLCVDQWLFWFSRAACGRFFPSPSSPSSLPPFVVCLVSRARIDSGSRLTPRMDAPPSRIHPRSAVCALDWSADPHGRTHPPTHSPTHHRPGLAVWLAGWQEDGGVAGRPGGLVVGCAVLIGWDGIGCNGMDLPRSVCRVAPYLSRSLTFRGDGVP